MKKATISRFYDITSDFNDSLSLIAILLIVNHKTELDFIGVKQQLCELEFDDNMMDSIEDLSLSISSKELGRLIRLLSPIDGLFVREKPRAIPKVITEGRKRFKSKRVTKSKRKKSKKKQIVQTIETPSYCKSMPTLF